MDILARMSRGCYDDATRIADPVEFQLRVGCTDYSPIEDIHREHFTGRLFIGKYLVATGQLNRRPVI